MNKKTKLTVSGGFHNVPPRNFRVKDDTLSIWQAHQLDAHLCGISDCKCGGLDAIFEVDGARVRIRRHRDRDGAEWYMIDSD